MSSGLAALAGLGEGVTKAILLRHQLLKEKADAEQAKQELTIKQKLADIEAQKANDAGSYQKGELQLRQDQLRQENSPIFQTPLNLKVQGNPIQFNPTHGDMSGSSGLFGLIGDEEKNALMQSHPELFKSSQGRQGPSPEEMRLKLITDVYGTPQLGVSQDTMDKAYLSALRQAQLSMPHIFGSYQPPTDPVDLFFHGLSTQEDVKSELEKLKKADKATYDELLPRIIAKAGSLPKASKAKKYGPKMTQQNTSPQLKY